MRTAGWGIWCRLQDGREFWLSAVQGMPAQTAMVMSSRRDAELIAAAQMEGPFCRPGDSLEVREFDWFQPNGGATA